MSTNPCPGASSPAMLPPAVPVSAHLIPCYTTLLLPHFPLIPYLVFPPHCCALLGRMGPLRRLPSPLVFLGRAISGTVYPERVEPRHCERGVGRWRGGRSRRCQHDTGGGKGKRLKPRLQGSSSGWEGVDVMQTAERMRG
jgi:hypothetical protein